MSQSEFANNYLTLDFNPSDNSNVEAVTIKELVLIGEMKEEYHLLNHKETNVLVAILSVLLEI